MRFIQLRSAPAQNAGPLPASTTARTALLFSISRKVLLSKAMRASSKALRSSGRSRVTRATPLLMSTFSMVAWWRGAWTLHTEDTEPGVFDRRVERGGNGETEEAARVRRVDHAVVPEPRARVIRMSLP